MATRAEGLEQSSSKRSDKKHFPHIDSDLDVTIITIVTPPVSTQDSLIQPSYYLPVEL